VFLAGFGASFALLLVFFAGLGAVGGASTAIVAFLGGETPLLSTLLPVTEQNVVVGTFIFCLQHLGEAPLSAPLL
jgi:hypothetical protein